MSDAASETSEGPRRVSNRMLALGILVVALLLAGIVSFYAASSPDGLTKVAQDQGFADTQNSHSSEDSPFAGYGSSFVEDERASVGIAGVVGVLVVLVAASGLTYVVRRRSPKEQ